MSFAVCHHVIKKNPHKCNALRFTDRHPDGIRIRAYLCSFNVDGETPDDGKLFERKINVLCTDCTKHNEDVIKAEGGTPAEKYANSVQKKRLLHAAENDREREIAKAKANAKANAKAEESE